MKTVRELANIIWDNNSPRKNPIVLVHLLNAVQQKNDYEDMMDYWGKHMLESCGYYFLNNTKYGDDINYRVAVMIRDDIQGNLIEFIRSGEIE